LIHRMVSIIFRQDAQLAPERLLAEYRRGRYPMMQRLGRLHWKDPEMRAIIPLDERYQIPRDVRRLLRKDHFTVSFDRVFRQVVCECRRRTPQRQGTWIAPEMIDVYTRLHELGFAHSVEVWNGDRLVGGGYGVSIGGFYAGESLFYRESNASKLALFHMNDRLRKRGFSLIDAQEASNLTRQFGVVEIPRAEFKELLSQAIARDVHF
jgi:leucyl/phenylalanyl-tRNA---protein transferase